MSRTEIKSWNYKIRIVVELRVDSTPKVCIMGGIKSAMPLIERKMIRKCSIYYNLNEQEEREMIITANDWLNVSKAEDFVDSSIEITEVGGVRFYARTFNERKEMDIEDKEYTLIL